MKGEEAMLESSTSRVSVTRTYVSTCVIASFAMCLSQLGIKISLSHETEPLGTGKLLCLDNPNANLHMYMYGFCVSYMCSCTVITL